MRSTRAMQTRGSRVKLICLLFVLASAIVSYGCRKTTTETILQPESFSSPESAGTAVYLAAHAGDTHAMLAIFGQDARDLLFTGDPTQDNLAFHDFAVDYEMMHRWAKLQNGSLVLVVGTENYPFPFPIVKRGEEQWEFSSSGARNEVLARRIGRNELAVIEVLQSMIAAQHLYFNLTYDGGPHQFAQKLVSRSGKHDGLYWKTVEGAPPSPVGPLLARASAPTSQSEARKPEPFHGYLYRIVAQQGTHARGGAKAYLTEGRMTGGFAFVAYPAEYRKSGVMTFQVNQDGVIYQKDFGSGTTEAVNTLDTFDPDESWTVVQ